MGTKKGILLLVLLGIIIGTHFVSASDAYAAYRSGNGICNDGLDSAFNCPKIRIWNSSGSGTWGSEITLATSGSPVREAVIRFSPVSKKLILITQGDDGFLDAYSCINDCSNESSWNYSSNIGRVWNIVPGTHSRRFDFAFEQSSGDAVLLYGVLNSSGNCDLASKVLPTYSISFDSTFSCVNDATTSSDVNYTWVNLDARNGSERIAAIGFDGNGNDISAFIWNGSIWNSQLELATSATSTSGKEALGIKYDLTGVNAVALAANGTTGDVVYSDWNGSSWSAIRLFDIDTGSADDLRFVSLKARPSSNGIQAVLTDSGSDLDTAYWNGTEWNLTSNIELSLDRSTERVADFAWGNGGAYGKLVYDEDGSGNVMRQITCAPECTASSSSISNYAGTGRWLTLFRNPTQADLTDILALRLNDANGIGSFLFDGTNFFSYGDDVITNDTTVNTFEAYSLTFQLSNVDESPSVLFVDPTPANNSVRTIALTVFNVSVSDNLGVSSCLLNYDGVNESMTLNGAVNGICTTTKLVTDGVHNFSVYVQDSSGLIVSTEGRTFTADSSIPQVSFVNPTDDSGYYNKSFIVANVSASDSSLAEVIVYLSNSSGIVSLVNSSSEIFADFSGLSEGTYFLNASARDFVGNINYTETRTIILDTSSPVFFNFVESPINNSQYASNGSYEFSVNLTEQNVNNVLIEFNSVLYPVSGNYRFVISSLEAGTYAYRWFANDSAGNAQFSDMKYYTVSKATPIGRITNSTSLTVVYPTQVTFGITESNLGDGDVSYNLFRDGTSIGNGESVTLPVGVYSYLLNSSEGINYSSSFLDQKNLTVLAGLGDVVLLINGSTSNMTIDEGDSINIQSILLSGSGNIRILVDGNIINEGASPLSNLTSFAVPGLHRIDAFYDGNVNYSGDNQTFYVFARNLQYPSINITSPLNANYSFAILLLNYTVSDDNLNACWYSTNLGVSNITTNCSESVLIGANEGANTWRVYANDTFGNENSSSVNFFVDTNAPQVSIIQPQEGETFGTNLSLALDFLAVDSGVGLSSCWYNLNDGQNITISCSNTTFNAGSSGSYSLRVYANDSLGNVASDVKHFSINLGAPSIKLVSPVGISQFSSDVTFLYNATENPADDLASCELWGNFSGVFMLNQSNNAVVSGALSSFYLNLSEGIYLWAIECLDDQNNRAVTGNTTVTVDKSSPLITLTDPRGTVSTRTNIPLSFNVQDASPISCVYNVYRGLNEEISNKSIACNTTTRFNVTVDADFVLNLYVNDSAGNKNFTSSIFSVSSSSNSDSGSNSGGGGSSGGGSSGLARASFGSFDTLSLRRGQTEETSIIVINSGTRFLNRCRFVSSGDLDWVDGDHIASLSPGQREEYSFVVNVPRNINPGNYRPGLGISCSELNASTTVPITVVPSDFDIVILSVSREDNSLVAKYTLQDYTQKEQRVTLSYTLIDSEGITIAEGNEDESVSAGAIEEKELVINLPKAPEGNFELSISISNGLEETEISQPVSLSRTTGLVISNNNRQTLTITGLVLVGLAALFFVARWLYRYHQEQMTVYGHNRLLPTKFFEM